MLINALPTLLNTMMHNKHLSHLMAKSMNELAHKSPLIFSVFSHKSPSGLYSACVTNARLRHITEVIVVKSY